VSTNRRISTVGTEESAPQADQLTQQPPPREPETWGTPLPPGAKQVDVPTQVEMRPHWSAKKVIGVVALAVVLVGGGTWVAIAATQTSTVADTHPSAGVTGGQVTGGSGGNRRGGYTGGYPGPLSNAVHGEFVARTDSGGYVTERFQSGKVTKVSSTALTVTSMDRYVGNYVIAGSTVINRGAATINDVKVGDSVTVLATLSGSTATATTVTDSADKQYPTTHSPGTGTGGMQPNDTTSANPGN
jgi:hypothetical protein